MKIRSYKGLLQVMILLATLNCLTVIVCAKTNSKVVIKSIADISFTLKQNSKFVQPMEVLADMSDGSLRKYKVVWNKSLDTTHAGVFTSTGAVKGYRKNITLKLNVQSYIVSAEDVQLTLNLNDMRAIPQSTQGVGSDGKVLTLPVKWSGAFIDTSQIGRYNFVGKIDGYDKEVYLNIVIKSDEKTLQQIATYKNTVVTILGYDDYGNISGFGSGFIVSQDGMLVTCYHVIDGFQNCRAVLENGKIFDIDYVSNYDKDKDIAILKLKNAEDMPCLTLGDSEQLNVGENMIAIGSPQGYENTVSNGIISGVDRTSDLRTGKDIQFTAGVTSGSSGGAILNMKGEAIGMVYSTYSTGNLSMAVPAKEIKSMLSESNKTSITALNPSTEAQVYELSLELKYQTFANGKNIVKPSEIFVDVDKEDDEVDITIDYYNTAWDGFTQKIYDPIMKQDSAVKTSMEAWLKAIYEEVKLHYPKMDVYGYVTGHKDFKEKPSDKKLGELSLSKVTGKWNAYRTFCTFSENEYSKDKPKEHTFKVTWNKPEDQNE